MSESLFTSAWDSFASSGEDGTWSIDVDLPPSFVMATAHLTSYEQHATDGYAYAGIRSYFASNKLTTFTGPNGVVGCIAEPNVSRITFAYGLGCSEGQSVLASFVLQTFIWD
ncbi:MAG: hypothetical protein ABI591_01830 [Kofleriaceae bacterium]